MSIDNTIGGITSLTNQVQTGVGTALATGADLGLTGLRGTSKPWYKTLKPASFKGVPFFVQTGESSFGRRTVSHEYPFRDTVWVEDLGRLARRFEVHGYLVGDDCIAQRDELIAACERPEDGNSSLVHPTYGERTVALVGPLRVSERWDKGRMFEIAFTVVESSAKKYPSDQQAAGSVVVVVGKKADAAAADDFKTRAATALRAGAAAVQKAVNLTTSWTATARRLTNDATNLVNMVSTIGGAVGRFANGRNVGGLTPTTSLAPSASQTVAILIAQGSTRRTAVASALATLNAGAAALSASTASSFATAAQSLVQAVSDAATDPADAVRLLRTLAQAGQSTDPSAAAGATSDLFRRAAVVAMARAALAYQPASVEDAASLRASVCQSIDDEITIAGDAGADDVYNTLRSLRAAVSADLASRGAGLPQTTTVASALPLPSLVLAQKLYRDGGRADELVTQSGCIHPAFMPTSFKALSK